MSQAPIYDSANRVPRALEEVRDVVKYRHLIVALVRRDIVTRYKRSYLGVAWTMLNPLGTMMIMTVVFSQLFGSTPSYPTYVLTGLVSWNFFSQVTTAAPRTLLWSGSLIRRVYVPRTVFALTAAGTGLVNLLLSLIPLAFVMLITQRPFTWALLYLPVAILLMTLFSLGVGLLLSSVVAYFPDSVDIYSLALMLWSYLSAVFYPYEIIPIEYRWWFFNLNPMYHLMLAFRDPLYYCNWPSWSHILTSTVVAVAVFAIGWLTFTKKADELAYRV